MVSNLMHMVGADMVPAACEELEHSRVAIYTTTESTDYKADPAAELLSKQVAAVLTMKVKKIKLVRNDEIVDYRDRTGWESVDLVKMGQATKADYVVAIDLKDLKLREGKTMFRGTASVEINVYDVESDSVIYTRTVDDYMFPRVAGQHVSETDEKRFRKLYLTMLAQEIGRSFHAYDFADTFAQDGLIASQ